MAQISGTKWESVVHEIHVNPLELPFLTALDMFISGYDTLHHPQYKTVVGIKDKEGQVKNKIHSLV